MISSMKRLKKVFTKNGVSKCLNLNKLNENDFFYDICVSQLNRESVSYLKNTRLITLKK